MSTIKDIKSKIKALIFSYGYELVRNAGFEHAIPSLYCKVQILLQIEKESPIPHSLIFKNNPHFTTSNN
ncbi:MAG: hypothetical protein P0116_11610 [Candidatus Nitrosocosmicus sp.]|nr:hypothetical protein [Candidatus Nitrosocosmicus sp.]